MVKNKGYEVLPFDLGTSDETLKQEVKESDFIIHLAGINRPLKKEEFLDGNVNLTKKLLDLITETGSKSPLVFSSSTQAALNNPYGESKKMAEDEIFSFTKERKHPVFVYRLYNVFGKWCRPNYNSVIATWCYNTTHNIPLTINPDAQAIAFVYIDDVIDEFLSCVEGKKKASLDINYPAVHYSKTLPEIASLLESFKETRKNFMTPDFHDDFAKKLYSTYLSYLDEDEFAYPLTMHTDDRGSFTEMLKTLKDGQISVNVSHPGITKGNHYHMSKNEKFIVVSGICEIKFRKIGTDNVITYTCDGKDIRAVDIPPGYTHSIKNIGQDDSVTIMWANELFNPDKPDTYYEAVEK